jgi:hypothetical protein
VLVLSASDFLWFVDQGLDGMVAIVTALGDDGANRRPQVSGTALAGANSPYVILTHCLGVMEYWGGLMVAGRPITRDRAAEFRAEGPVAPLVERARTARRQLEADVSGVEPEAPTRRPPGAGDAELPYGRTQGGVLLHILEELLQHLGQMEITRDVLLASPDPV